MHSSPSRRKWTRRLPLHFEVLEDRTLLSGFAFPLQAPNQDGPTAPTLLTDLNGVAIFAASDHAHGQELWKSDGTRAGTSLLMDIFPGPDSSGIDSLVRVNNKLFFVAADTRGYELWVTDGTPAGTVALPGVTNPSGLANVNGTLFFTGYDGVQYGLWKSDGTAAGTVEVSTAVELAQNITDVNGTAFFAGYDRTHGNELWKSDGTAAGTSLVAEINPGLVGAYPANLTNVDGRLIFSAFDLTHGRELWVSDGTTAGTQLVKDIRPGAYGLPLSSQGSLSVLNGKVYFPANDGVYGTELWSSDGTAAGTQMVTDITPGAAGTYPISLTNVDGTLYFGRGQTPGNFVYPFEVWKSDGTAGGTVMVKQLMPATYSSPFSFYPPDLPSGFTGLDGKVYFTADGPTGKRIWETDGTDGGTSEVQPSSYTSPDDLTVSNGKLLFDGSHTLWAWDPHAEPSIAISDASGFEPPKGLGTLAFTVTLVLPSSTTITVDYATADDSAHAGVDYRATSGTLTFNPGETSKTISVTSIEDGVFDPHDETFFVNLSNPNPTTASLDVAQGVGTILADQHDKLLKLPTVSHSRIVNLNGTAYYIARDAAHGQELWKSDGTPAGSTIVADINPGPGDGAIGEVFNAHGKLFFTGFDSGQQFGLWTSDGTAAGTQELMPGMLLWSQAAPGSTLTVGSDTYFFALDPASDFELWKSDGTTTGTVLLHQFPALYHYNNPANLTELNGTVYFSIAGGNEGQLWKTDGTAAGTANVSNLFLVIREIVNFNGSLILSARSQDYPDSVSATELWRSDGTAAGTVLIKDIAPAPYASSYPTGLTLFHGAVYFLANDRTDGYQLWKSDGSTAGTTMVTTVFHMQNLYTSTLTIANSSLFFTATDGSNGMELWKSDGTAAGTVQISHIRPDFAVPTYITNVAGDVFFSATDPTYGDELFVSDGTASGTMLVQDLNPGLANANPSRLASVGNKLFFTAYDGIPDPILGPNPELFATTPFALEPVAQPSVRATGGFTFTTTENGPATVSGTVATFTDPLGMGQASDYAATIAWGDNTMTAGIITPTDTTGDFKVTGEHTYPVDFNNESEGSNTPAITVTISHGATTPQVVTDSATITDPAVVATGGSSFTVNVGSPVSGTVATFTDAGDDITAPPTSLDVTVTDNSFNLLAGAQLLLQSSSQPSQTLMTDANGHASFSGIPAGVYSLTASLSGYQTATFPAFVQEGVNGVSEALTQSPVGIISGIVTDNANIPLANVQVTVLDANNNPVKSATTIGDGSYSIAGIPAGTYSMSFTLANYNPGSANVTVASGATTTQNEQLTPAAATASVTITITDNLNGGAFIFGALVQITYFNGTSTPVEQTNQQGVVQFSNQPVGIGLSINVTTPDGRNQTLLRSSGLVSGLNDISILINPEDLNDYIATVNWGDGTSTTGVVSGPDSNDIFSVGGGHTYSMAGVYSVSTTISHDATTPQMVTSTVTVQPLASILTSPLSPAQFGTTAVPVAGTGLAGATVTFLDGGTADGTILVDGNGNFSTIVTLAIGSHSLTATQTFGGATSAASNTLIIAVLPPHPVITSPTQGTLTTNTQVTVAGTGLAGAAVALFDFNVAVPASAGGTGMVAADGTFTITASLAVGDHSFLVRQTFNGETSGSNIVDMRIVPLPPVITSPANGATFTSTSVSVSGTGLAGATVNFLDGGVAVGTPATVDANGNFSTTLTLSFGSHSLTATQFFNNERSAASTAVSVTLMAQPAAPVITSPSNGAVITNSNSVTVIGTGVAGAAVTILDGGVSGLPGGSTNVTGNGTFTATVFVGLGMHSLSATQTVSGITSAPSNTVNVTVQPPPPSITSPANGAMLTSTTVTVSGVGLGGFGGTITIFDGGSQVGSVPAASNGTFTTTVSLGVGNHSLTATQTIFNVSSVASAAVTVMVVPAPAAPVITSPVDGANLFLASVTFSGTGTPGATISLRDNGAPIFLFPGTNNTVAADGTFSFTVSQNIGPHSDTATQTLGGVTSAPSNTVNITVHPIPPTITSPTDGFSTTNPLVTVSGFSLGGFLVTIFDAGVPIATTTHGGPGTTYSVAVSLGIGSHSLSAIEGFNGTNSIPSNIVNVAVVPPAPVIASPASGATFTSTAVTVSGTGVAGATVNFLDGGVADGSTSVDGNGNFTAIVTLGFGSHSLSATQTAGGATSVASNTVSLTVQPAAPVITSPANGAVFTTTNSITVTGTGVPGASVSVFYIGIFGTVNVSLPVPVGANGMFSTTVVVTYGTSSIHATQSASGVGSASSNSVSVTVVPLAPVITSPTNGASFTSTSVPVTGTAVFHATVAFFDNGSPVGTPVMADINGNFSTTLTLGFGSHSLTATQTASGSTSPASSPITFTIVNPATSLNVAPATGSFGGTTTLSATLTTNGQPLANETITFSLNGTGVGTAVTNGSGVATLPGVSLAGISSGTYPTGVAASFAGDGTYAHSAGSASLTVNAANAQTQITALANQVAALVSAGVLASGNANALTTKLNNAISSFNSGNITAGVNQLNAFINQVNAFLNSGKLTSAQAQALISAANQAIATANAGGIHLTDGATGDTSLAQGLSQPVTAVGDLVTGVIGVYLSEPAGAITADEQARFDDAVRSLDATFSPYGVDVVDVGPANASSAVVAVVIADTSPAGTAADGVLGCTVAGQVTLLTGWNWYTGADPTAVAAGQYDFQTIVSHELGHSIGLGHSGDPNSVMYPYLSPSQVRRTLTAVDLSVLDTPSSTPEPLLAAGLSPGARSQSDSGAIAATLSRRNAVAASLVLTHPATLVSASPIRVADAGRDQQPAAFQVGQPAQSTPLAADRSLGGGDEPNGAADEADDLGFEMETCVVVFVPASGLNTASPGTWFSAAGTNVSAAGRLAPGAAPMRLAASFPASGFSVEAVDSYFAGADKTGASDASEASDWLPAPALNSAAVCPVFQAGSQVLQDPPDRPGPGIAVIAFLAGMLGQPRSRLPKNPGTKDRGSLSTKEAGEP